MISGTIKGGDQLNALLQKLPIEVETKILGNGLVAGANVIRDEARSRARKKSGQMAAGIKTGRRTDRDEGRVVATVKLTGKHRFLGLLIEQGVLPHLIWASAGKGTLVINGVPIGKQVEHPGHAAFPFMRPALDAGAAGAVAAFGDYLTRYLSWGTIAAPTINADEAEAA